MIIGGPQVEVGILTDIIPMLTLSYRLNDLRRVH